MYKTVDSVDILRYIRESKHNTCMKRVFFLIMTFICSFFQLEVPNYHHLLQEWKQQKLNTSSLL